MSAAAAIDLPDAEATDAFGRRIARVLRAGDAIALSGTLGAGKTTLARGILAGLGLADAAASPSFPIVIAYAPPELRLPVWHVDLYRIEKAGELDELGLHDARTDTALLIEWPDRLGAALWADTLRLALDAGADGGRRLTAEVPPAWEARWPPPPMTPPPHAPAFLAAHGWEGAAIAPLAGDASFRRYFRVTRAGETAVLMDAPPEHEDSRPFLTVAGQLRALGFRPPAVIAQDLDEGLVLLEDFGDRRMAEAVAADPAAEHAIYAQAIDLLRDLHRHPAGDLPRYDMAVLQREAALFVEWYAPAVGLDVDAAGYGAAWEQALAGVAGQASVTVLRDYHAENVMLLADGALGLLDFQDALAGHPAYDLVSLLQDARRDVGEALESAMLARYGAIDRDAYALLGAQRNAKILGIFTRLWKRDGKDRYLAYQPRVWAYLERDLACPALAGVRDWFDANVPAAARAAAWTRPRG